MIPQEITTFSLLPETPRPPVVYVNGGAETYEVLCGGALMAHIERTRWDLIHGVDHLSIV